MNSDLELIIALQKLDSAAHDALQKVTAAPGREHALAARIALETQGNRTHENGPENPRGVAVMLHGLTDAPYSLESVGRMLRERGFHVVWLRLPGHGTIPGALRVQGQLMADVRSPAR